VNLGLSFRSQAKRFIEEATRRKRKPVKPATTSTWNYALDKWILPSLGDLPLAKVDNDTVKPLVGKMHAAGLSPKSIENYVGFIKLVVKSAKEKGRELFPRIWSNEEMNVPEIKSQRRPYFTAERVSAIISHSGDRDRALFAVLAGTGLRIGEALGLELGKHISPDCRTLDTRNSIWQGTMHTPKRTMPFARCICAVNSRRCSRSLSGIEQTAFCFGMMSEIRCLYEMSWAEACIPFWKKSSNWKSKASTDSGGFV
jgi:site-specific recombinase XerC